SAGPRAAPAAEALAWLAARVQPNDTPRVYALRALAEVGPAARAVLPTLLAQLDDPSWSVRYAVLDAMGRIAPDDARVRAAAQRATSDESEAVRGLAQGLLRPPAP
ncbi:MAG: HEAT repeat domain-containing protein, partial [Myxococcales bacterium]|nr:HEAT repeat domain-containing protein [Myxococcales bacterium]